MEEWNRDATEFEEAYTRYAQRNLTEADEAEARYMRLTEAEKAEAESYAEMERLARLEPEWLTETEVNDLPF